MLIFYITMLSGCMGNTSKTNLQEYDIALFKNSPVRELAKCVASDDTSSIKKDISKNRQLLDYQETNSGYTLLYWAVITNHLASVRVLCELGADPNIQSYDGTNAVIMSARKYESSDFLKVLLHYGGSISNVFKCKDGTQYRLVGTPLIEAAENRLESVKLLIKAGADPNYKTEDGQTALSSACLFDRIDIAQFLMINCKVDFKSPVAKDIDGNPVYIVNYFRTGMLFPLDSKDHKIKMELVAFMKKQGVDYRKTKIPDWLYDNHDSDYLQKY